MSKMIRYQASDWHRVMDTAKAYGVHVYCWTPGDGYTRYRAVHVPSLPAFYHAPGAELSYESVSPHQLTTMTRAELFTFLAGLNAAMALTRGIRSYPACVDCGDRVVAGVNDPVTPGEDGEVYDPGGDLLCFRCFSKRHVLDRE